MATDFSVNRPTGPMAEGGDGSVAAWLVGGGILLIQACAVIPGLLPCLILLLPLVLPVVILGVAGALLVALPLAVWRLVARTARPQGARR